MEGKRALLFLAALLLVSDVASASWTSFRGNPENSGGQGFSVDDVTRLNPDLEFKGDGSIQGAVVGTGDLIAFNTINGSLYLTDTRGEIIHKRQVRGQLFNSPLLDLERGSVVIATSEGEVISYGIDRGNLEWNMTIGEGASIHSSPKVRDGKLVITSYDSNVYCLDSSNGHILWTFTGCGGQIHTTPAFSEEGLVFFGSCDGSLYALHLENGTEAWSFQAEYIPSSPAVSNGKVFFGSFDENLYCLEAVTGDKVWNVSLGSSVFSSPSVTDDHVCIGTDDGYLYLLDPNTGSVLWSIRISESSLETSPVIIEDRVLVTSENGLRVLSIENGSVERGFELGDSSSCSPSVIDEALYFGDRSGYVRSVKETSEREEEVFDIGVEDDPRSDLIALLLGVVILIIVGIGLYIGYLRMRNN